MREALCTTAVSFDSTALSPPRQSRGDRQLGGRGALSMAAAGEQRERRSASSSSVSTRTMLVEMMLVAGVQRVRCHSQAHRPAPMNSIGDVVARTMPIARLARSACSLAKAIHEHATRCRRRVGVGGRHAADDAGVGALTPPSARRLHEASKSRR